MRKVFYVFVSLAILILLSWGCALHLPPYDLDWESPVYRVRLLVDPDDAVVLLNGRLKGHAYEFSTWDSAIRLASRNNEIVIKKEGYMEEAVDLYNYYSRRITVRLKLLKDKDYTAPVKQPKPLKPPKLPKKKPAYIGKTEPPKKLPEEPLDEIKPGVKPVDVFLEIFPAESSIYLDGRFWGISPKSGKIENLRLKPGTYTLELVKPGYKAYKKRLNVDNKKLRLLIKLEKK